MTNENKQVISRKEAKHLGLTRYFTGEPCKSGHVDLRITDSGVCVQCRSIMKKKKTAERRKALGLPEIYRPVNEEDRKRHYRDYKKKLAQDNKESVHQRVRDWVKQNPEKARQNKRNYTKRNPWVAPDWLAKRRANIKNRTPKWLTPEDFKKIKNKYKEAKWMSVRSGFVHHVDHIIPLNGKTVSGLHVPENLRVIPKCHNQRKGCRFDEKYLAYWPIY